MERFELFHSINCGSENVVTLLRALTTSGKGRSDRARKLCRFETLFSLEILDPAIEKDRPFTLIFRY